jgi:hypothetical protein
MNLNDDLKRSIKEFQPINYKNVTELIEDCMSFLDKEDTLSGTKSVVCYDLMFVSPMRIELMIANEKADLEAAIKSICVGAFMHIKGMTVERALASSIVAGRELAKVGLLEVLYNKNPRATIITILTAMQVESNDMSDEQVERITGGYSAHKAVFTKEDKKDAREKLINEIEQMLGGK